MEVLCLNCYSDVLLKAASLEPDMLRNCFLNVSKESSLAQ